MYKSFFFYKFLYIYTFNFSIFVFLKDNQTRSALKSIESSLHFKNDVLFKLCWQFI